MICENEITNDMMFRKYISELTNNQHMTDMICRINTACADPDCEGEDGLNPSEVFAQRLYNAVPLMDLVTDICRIRDLIYGDGSITLDVDPTYRDATVETEARPKNQTIAWFQAVKPQGPDMADQMRGMRQRMHDMKFNPMKVIEDDRRANMSELERLLYEMPEQNPFYDRF